jgi:hypothetical protein
MKSTKQFVSIGLIIFVMIALYGIIKTNMNKTSLKEFDKGLEYFGVVSEIKIDTMNHSTPSFLINGKWIYLGSFGYSIDSIVLPGDSISKVIGEDYLEIHRTRTDGYTLVKRIYAW